MFLLVIPIAILNGFINARAINKNLFGKYWHNVQFYILSILLAYLLCVNIVAINEVLLIMALYYAAFEISLNLFRVPRKAWNYVGYTSFLDRHIRSAFNGVLKPDEAFIFTKIVAILFGIAIYFIL